MDRGIKKKGKYENAQPENKIKWRKSNLKKIRQTKVIIIKVVAGQYIRGDPIHITV